MRRRRWTTLALAILLGAFVLSLIPGQLALMRLDRQNKQCFAHLTKLGQTLNAFALNHGGVYPIALDELIESGQISAGKLACPVCGQSYVYFGGQIIDDDHALILMLYPKTDNHRPIACNVDGEMVWLNGGRENAIAFAEHKIAELDARIGLACGVSLARGEDFEWMVSANDGSAAPPDDTQLDCLYSALRQIVTENTPAKKCRDKWAEIAENDYRRRLPTGDRLFYLRQSTGTWRIAWRTSRTSVPLLGIEPQDFSLTVEDFIANLAESEHERARETLLAEIATAGREQDCP